MGVELHCISAMAFGPTEKRIVGAGLIGFGAFFAFFGFAILDNGLLAMGNILFLSGVTLILGPPRCLSMFSASESVAGSVGFVVGILLVLAGWARVGVMCE